MSRECNRVHALKHVQFGRAVDLMRFNTSVNRAIRPRDFFYANIVTSREMTRGQ